MPFALSLETIPQKYFNACLHELWLYDCSGNILGISITDLGTKSIQMHRVQVYFLCTESLFANVFGFVLLHEAKSPIMILGGLFDLLFSDFN